ncbi:uncharacterized protein LAESUDRAFT_733817 [Laetiporus sulphureus 93-53]|uniref:IncA domain-containing protein n=1 Tax=Laetiporus sulphureus 93-53 TaxID=1314785 RepID=A0A165HLK3_9APHY|nr:uncharacterized protein LAESUDRAFT_733817 [Laetiporus sulphureus 93-53]KZT11890.1 hypothetical protein LAESUDRAFT_733817 [Laetiporus sulphureus 93-53]
MSSLLRLGLYSTPPVLSRVCGRLLSTSRVVRDAAAPTPNLGTVPAKKPVGAFRGGIVGFLFGFSLASSVAAYHLLEEYKLASAALQASVEELQLSTQKVSAHVRRIEAVEKELKALSDSSATKEDISRVRAEMKKLYDGLHVEFLDLRSYVWGIQQDVHALSKKESSSVRLV